MHYALPLLIGFLSSSIGVIPPGMLNMTALKIRMHEGKSRAFVFALGACLILCLQALIAVSFARYLERNPVVLLHLREAGAVLFLLLSVYFFFFAKPPVLVQDGDLGPSKRSRFFGGMLLSCLNFFPIPFYVFVGLHLAANAVAPMDLTFLSLFVAGILLGSLFGFYCFTTFFVRLADQTRFLIRNMNRTIAIALFAVAAYTIVQIVFFDAHFKSFF